MGLFGSDDSTKDFSGEEIGRVSSEGSNRPSELRRVVDEEAGVVLYYVLGSKAAGLTSVPLDQTDLDPAGLDEEVPEEY